MRSTRLISMIAVIALTLAPACGRKESAPAPARTPSAAAPAPPSAAAPAAWKGFRPEDGPIVTGNAVSSASLSPSEQKYGIAPARGAGVVYQDQVVLKLVHATPISANGTLAKFKEPFRVLGPERYQLPVGCAGGAGT